MIDLAVIMSIYKKDKLNFVKESVQSILSQTYTRFHLYLIFDGPVSAEIDEYISNLQDLRLRLFRSQLNMGLAKAMNLLLGEVLKNQEYRFIARMDADDISMPERFGLQREFLIRHNDISCVGSWYREIDEDGKQLSERKLPTGSEDLRNYYFKRAPFAHPSVMYRRELIEIAGFYPVDTILLEDNVLWGNALQHGLKFANIPEFLLKFRIDKDFFKRRSGIKYGWNYIISRFKIIKRLNSQPGTYLYSLFSGLIRMLPSYLFRLIYKSVRYKS